MKISRKILAAVASLCAVATLGTMAPTSSASSPTSSAAVTVAPLVKVMSWNVKSHATSIDGYNGRGWPLRKDEVAAMITKHAPAIAGLQEVLYCGNTDCPVNNVDPLSDLLALPGMSNYASYPTATNFDKRNPRTILYRKDRFTLLPQRGQFDFTYSGTLGESDLCKNGNDRVTWATLQDNWPAVDGPWAWNKYFVVNAHLPSRSPSNPDHCDAHRVAAVAQIHQLIKQQNPSNLPVIVTGDFNAERDVCLNGRTEDQENTIANMRASSSAYPHNLEVVDTDCVPTGNNLWDTSTANDRAAFDYIFYSNARFTVADKVVDNSRTFASSTGTVSPSDHYPVIARLRRR
jgi:exonuclease III